VNLSLLSELKNRKVFTTAVIYVPSAWLGAEILVFLADRFGAPQWVGDVIAVLFVLGFPVALLLSWLFDLTRDGVKRSSPGTPLGITVLLASGLFLSTSVYISYQVFSGRLSEISVAILPLKSNTADPNAQPYGLGIADSLRSSLQRMPVFRVPARISSEAVVQAGLDIPGIASRLDVSYVVEGTIEMVGQNLNISVSLTDKGGEVQWSERFERATRDIFDLQNDLVRAVALELGMDESDAELQRNTRKSAPTQDMEAHRLYLQGKYIHIEPGVAMGNSDAMEALKAARIRDPGYADVYSAIAFLYGFDCWLGEDFHIPECELAIHHANQGLQLDPDQADALTTLAMVHSLRYEYREAQSAVDRYLALANTTLVSSSLPWAYLNLGYLQEAWDSAQEYYRNDPLNGFAIGNMVTWAAVLKKDDAMAEHYENIMLEMMGFSVLSLYPSKRLHRVGRQTAIQDFRKMVPAWGVSPELADIWVSALYDPSQRPDALLEFQAWHERGDLRDETYWHSLLILNQTDQAIDMAFDLFDQGVLNPAMAWFDFPGGKEFRSHPRFIELLEYTGLAPYWDDVGWPLFCEPRGTTHNCGLDWAVE
jgi:TolB-like protein